MEKLTWPEANDKIIDAYFKDEIRPFDAKFCVCGTLCNNSDEWHGMTGIVPEAASHLDFMGYKGADFVQIEVALLLTIAIESKVLYGQKPSIDRKKYEDVLFKGMCAALDVLKEIHRNRGENVDEVPVFRKRLLKADATNQPAITY